jgi:hypothetical protein
VILVKGIRIPRSSTPLLAPAPVLAPELTEKFELEKYERTVYPYSVIPGGVRSREELASSMSSDPVVAAHFADFRVGDARIVRAEETRLVYVSYRMRDKVFWTSRKIKVPKGETLITDGEETARTRCGNRVSAVPVAPVSEEEPIIETFEVPLIAGAQEPARLNPVYESPLQPMVFSPLEFTPTQPGILPYYYRPLFVVRPTSDIVVPEPGSLSLLIVGMAAFFLIKAARRNT